MRTTPPIELYRATEHGFAVDRPSQGRFREPLDGPLPGGLTPVATPSTMDAMCGWYDHGDRTILLAHIPEAYWGEPMVLIGEGDTVWPAYATGEHTFVREDGETFDLGGSGPFERSHRLHESEVEFEAGGVTLAGTLITPAGPGPFPAAVMLHGAAGGQRDYQRIVADPVLKAGIAVLIYDKRGHGRSGGAPEPTIFDQAGAAQAALELLARTPTIDARRRGLVGFSNGMWAAPMVTGRRTDVAFLAGGGAPGVSMAEAEVHRRTKVLRDAGVGADTLGIVEAVWRCVFRMAAMGVATDTDVDRLVELTAKLSTADDLNRYEIPDYVRQNPMLAPYPPAEVPAEAIAAMVTAEASPELAYAPAVDYARTRCPVFLQYGSNDVSVPVTASVEAITAALPDAQIRVYADLEHQLNVAPRALAGLSYEEAQYLFHDFRFGAGVREELTAWLRATTA